MKKIACMTVCIALLVFLVAPVASAQLLDGQWFQMKFKVKGLLITGDAVAPANYSGVSYLKLQWNAVSSSYDYEVHSWDGASWRIGTGQDVGLYGPKENVTTEWVSDLYLTNTEHLSFNKQTSFTIKNDSSGQLKSATISSLSCSAYGTWLGSRHFYGGCTMKGKTIDPSKLPFTQ